MENDTNTIEEEEKELEELINCKCHCHVTAPDPKYCECPFFECKHCIKDKILNSLLKDIEKMDALTPIGNKCMDKVYDNAKKPQYGTNFLERETIINLITQYKNGKETKKKD